MVEKIQRLKASLCQCGQVMVPPRKKCISCSGNNTGKMIEISNKGKLLSFTILNIPPEGFDSPLILGIVEIDLNDELYENKGIRDVKYAPKLICQGLNSEILEDDLEIGINVEIKKKDELYFFRIIR